MIYKNVVALCKEKNISIRRLERETGISNGAIGRWDISSPTVENLKKVADFFGVSIDSLISGVPPNGAQSIHLADADKNR